MTKRHPSSRARTARERILLFCMSTDSQRAGVTGETVTALTALTARGVLVRDAKGTHALCCSRCCRSFEVRKAGRRVAINLTRIWVGTTSCKPLFAFDFACSILPFNLASSIFRLT
jgi:hypothetical protein